jgi:threonine dehydrogenase-like Zn-dependent dehydrogenase
LILGSGSIGLSVLIVAKMLGFAKAISVDISECKRSLALQCKADAYINAAAEDLVPAVKAIFADGADITLVTSSYADAMRDAAAATKPGGEIIVVSYFEGELSLDLNHLVQNEVAVRGSALSTERDFKQVISWLVEGRIDSLPMITHYFPLSDVAIAMQLMNSSVGASGKIMFQPFHVVGSSVQPRRR